MSLEELAKQIFDECAKDGEPITHADALEMAQMEMGAKSIKNYTQSTVEKKKAKREVKQDEDKITIIQNLFSLLTDCDLTLVGLEVKNQQREVTFAYNGNDYSLTLTKHRK